MPIFTMIGGDLASTWVLKLKAHAEDVADLVKYAAKSIIANDPEIAIAA